MITFSRDGFAGVYELWNGDECLYVGQTSNLFSRLPSHWEKSYTEVRFTQIQDSAERNKLEGRKIQKLSPTLNKRGVSVGNAFSDFITVRGLTNPEVAEAIGITEWHVSRLRNGQSPSMPLAKVIKVWSAGAVPIESWDEEAAA